MFTDTVTIYNRYKENGQERWQRHVLTGVNWTDTVGSTVRKTGVVPAHSTTFIIPKAVLVDYVPPVEFSALEDKSGKWTVAPKDTMVLGAVDVEISTTPSKDLIGVEKVRQILNVDGLLHGRLAHLEVSGK